MSAELEHDPIQDINAPVVAYAPNEYILAMIAMGESVHTNVARHVRNVEHGQLMRAGRCAQAMLAGEVAVPEQDQAALEQAVAEGVQAKGQLLLNNLPLVRQHQFGNLERKRSASSIFRGWQSQQIGQRPSIDEDDVWQSLLEDLYKGKALDNWDFDLIKLSTRLHESMRGPMQRAIARGPLVRISSLDTMHADRQELKFANRGYVTPLGDACNSFEFEEPSNIPPVIESFEWADDSAVAGDAPALTLAEHHESPVYQEDFVEELGARTIVPALIALLSERDQDIIRLRFGLDGERPHTLEEVAQKYGCTRQAIKQYQTRAFKTMRNRAKMLAG